MKVRRSFFPAIVIALAALCPSLPAPAQSQSSSSTSPKHIKKPATSTNETIDAGAVTNNIYRNKTFAVACKVPEGWVLRTDELNERDQEERDQQENNRPDSAPSRAASSAGAKVLLAAFSRPPEAHGEDVNSSILIAAEPASSYPGLKDAAQYLDPLTEVAKAQGFTEDEDPYQIAVGTKPVVRGDFHKDLGTRVMHQSTLVLLSHGYAVSITIIAGTEDEVENLIDGLTFSSAGK